MKDGPIIARAKRIKSIRKARKSGIFDNHLGASPEFQLLDAVRDIRLILFIITLILALMYVTQRPATVINYTPLETRFV